MLRLVVFAPNGVERAAVTSGELVVGHGPDCGLRLGFPGVGERHAVFRLQEGRLEVEGVDVRHPVLVNDRRVREAVLQPLDQVRLGSITLLVEEATGAEEAGLDVPPPDDAPPSPSGSVEVDPSRFLEHLAHVSDWVVADSESHTTLESLVNALLLDLGGGVLYLFQGDLTDPVIKFVVATHAPWLASGEEVLDQLRERHAGDEGRRREPVRVEGSLGGRPAQLLMISLRALERPYALVAALPSVRSAEEIPAVGFKTLGELLILGLVHHVGRYEPILPGRRGRQELVLDSGVILGESAVSRRLLEQLRAAARSSVQVLLVGEPGTGKSSLARSLHLSGGRPEGPFVVADCAGAEDFQVEADLFGAEVQGKDGPIRREGKLALADGGTLFIDNIQLLPVRAQERLARFLKLGEVESGPSRGVRRLDLRLVAASPEPLEPMVARNAFRADLAYLLSRCLIEVPALRQRREELPLVIQAYLNRFCHEVGTRIQGITVKAMSALTIYPYLGNFPELEGIVRQLVSLCPPGRPVDTNLLPERVRLASLQAVPHVDGGSDLDLERLVEACERQAIREALRRCDGNKTQAARLLGISRNGLQLKIRRYGIQD